jgi:hypothetical protein
MLTTMKVVEVVNDDEFSFYIPLTSYLNGAKARSGLNRGRGSRDESREL